MKKIKLFSCLLLVLAIVLIDYMPAAAKGDVVEVKAAQEEPEKILFIGNSFTYGKGDVQTYNADNVTDLNHLNYLNGLPGREESFSGVSGIFEKLTEEAGLNYDVNLSARGGASLRGQYLNLNPEKWDLRGNIASDDWDIVIMQGQSTESLDKAEGNYDAFEAYLDKIEQWVHKGQADRFKESDLYEGGSDELKEVPANEHADASTSIYTYQTWARPDMIYPDESKYDSLEEMTDDLLKTYQKATVHNGHIVGMIPVGNAFLHATDFNQVIKNPYSEHETGIDLWWQDHYHPSEHGAYLSALMMFGAVTGIDPQVFDEKESAASDLNINVDDAGVLQQIASEELIRSGYNLYRAKHVSDITHSLSDLYEAKEIDTHQIYAHLNQHLEAVKHFEQTDQKEKIVKHLKGFVDLAEHYRNQNEMSEFACYQLKNEAHALITKMQADMD